MYGNVATIDPQNSDPRYYDYKNQITTKKLWVAAVDLNAAPGTDPSHPAFYLPAQELQAGNARGYWVLDPCEADGMSCQTGDQCCGGYCQASADGGLVCGHSTPSCSGLGDKCTTASNCCNAAAACINGICSLPTPLLSFRRLPATTLFHHPPSNTRTPATYGLYRASNFSVSLLTRYRLLQVSPFFGFQFLSGTHLPLVHLTCTPSVEHETALSSSHGSSSGTMLLSQRAL